MNTDEARRWRVSSYSGSGANCVAVAVGPHVVGVRDSKNPEGGTLSFPSSAWAGFSRALKS
ncbi:MAG: DUF397 domain-containing protein [Saccharothrix sp.]|nr:DUF397 domain-containing protein [Saccharothrix sp.]